jgi:hypothetical protein
MDTKLQELLDKIRSFHQLQQKVHLTKKPTIKFPTGKWYNGLIMQYLSDKQKILFLDDKEDAVEIFLFEIMDVEPYRERKKNEKKI